MPKVYNFMTKIHAILFHTNVFCKLLPCSLEPNHISSRYLRRYMATQAVRSTFMNKPRQSTNLHKCLNIVIIDIY